MGVPTLGILGLPFRSPRTKCHLDVGLVERRRVYYKGEGGGFPQVRAMMSLVSPSLHMAHPNTKSAQIHYYILRLFAKGQTKTWRVYEGKTTCHICNATCIAPCGPPPIANLYCTLQSLQHFCNIYHKENFATHSVSVHPSDIPHFAMFSHTQNITHFMIQNVSLKTLRVTKNCKLALFDASHFAFEYVSQTSSQIFTKLSGGGRIASCDVR